ncbi:MAG: serine dehydratase beta chain [[Clostridium] scindens]
MDVSIFSVLGPVMIGPSSSHTAGAARLSKAAARIAGGRIKKVSFGLHGSFAKTYKGHATDKALLAGVLGLDEQDENIIRVMNWLTSQLKYEFYTTDLGDVHENSVKMDFLMQDGRTVSVTGSSVGGGEIEILEKRYGSLF